MDWLDKLCGVDGFMPHGTCYLWNTRLVWLHVLSDAVIGLAYATIPFTLLYIVRKRRDLPFGWMFLCFGTFIIACGATHWLELWSVWRPVYWLSGGVKAVTATASVITAGLLIKLIPAALAIPSTTQLSDTNRTLEAEIQIRKTTEAELRKARIELEQRIQERTKELEQANASLRREIEDRLPIENALRQSEERYRQIVDTAQEGIWLLDNEARTSFVNRRMAQMLGYAPTEMMGRSLYEFMDNASVIPAKDNFGSPQPELAETRDFRFRCKDGSEIWALINTSPMFNDAGQIVGALGMVSDITERRLAHEALRQSEERYRALVEQSLVGIYVIQDGKFAYVNPKMEEIIGYPAGELLTKPLLTFVAESDHELVRANISRRLERVVDSVHYQLRLRRPDGSVRIVETHGARSEFNCQPAIAGAVLDVTEKHQAEQEVHRLNSELDQRVKDRTAQLEAANKELEAFSYSISHDLRAPLRAISGFARILEQDFAAPLTADGRRYLQIISQNARQMGQLIDDLLAFSRLSRKSVDFGKVDLRGMLNFILEDLQRTEPGRPVEVSIGELPSVHGDEAMLRQVMINLLANAFKFTRHQKQPRIEIGARIEGENTLVWCRDNGVGFEMQYAHKLFGVFQRLHRAEEFEGTGVGLAIVQRIIHRHEGEIWAEAKVNEGATFYFRLPNRHGMTT